MKRYQSKKRNIFYFLYRLLNPIYDPIKTAYGVKNYFKYIGDLLNYQSQSKENLLNTNMYPILNESTPETLFDAHYFYQQIWAYKKVIKSRIKTHTDFGSSYQLAGYLSTSIKTTFVDIRPIQAKLEHLNIVKDSLTNLEKFKTNSIESASCLHVIEHIGLGRYGDPIDVEGPAKAAGELSRILKPGGTLYISCPIGKKRTCFNAHRVFHPNEIVNLFSKFKLKSFSVVDDDKNFVETTSTTPYESSNYACGLFEFTK